jgi:hypothetical protein
MLDQGAGNSTAIRANLTGTNTGNKTVMGANLDNNAAAQVIGANFNMTGTGTGQETGVVYQSTSANPSTKIAFRNFLTMEERLIRMGY